MNNIKKIIISFFSILIFTISYSYADNVKLKKDDFAYGYQINEILSDEAFYQIRLPEDIYQSSIQELNDIRILDAKGRILPASLFSTVQARKNITYQPLRIFPINDLEQNKDSRTKVSIDTDNNNLVLQVNKNEKKAFNKKTKLYALLLPKNFEDNVKKINTLEINWTDSNENWKAKVILYNSNIQPLDNTTTIYNFINQNDKLILNKINFSKEPLTLSKDYPIILALIPNNDEDLPEIDSINIVEESETINNNFINLSPSSKKISSNEIEYYFNNPQYFDYLSIISKEKNALFNVKVEYKSDANQKEWLLLTNNFKIYLFDQQQNKDLSVDTKIAAIKLSFDQDYLANNIPSVIAKKKAYSIIFNKQGEQPFTLVVGQANAGSKFMPLKELLGNGLMKKFNDNKNIIPIATLENKETLAGKDALIPIKKINYKKYIIWALLVLCSLVLIFFAVNLLRELKKQGNNKE